MSEDPRSGLDGGAREPRRSLLNPWFLAALAGFVLIPALRPLLRFEPDPPPVLRQLPQWRLVDQNGGSFGSDDLAGGVYVASFLFTRCATVCPRLTASLRQLERRYREEGVEEVTLVSFTVDPSGWTSPAAWSMWPTRHGWPSSTATAESAATTPLARWAWTRCSTAPGRSWRNRAGPPRSLRYAEGSISWIHCRISSTASTSTRPRPISGIAMPGWVDSSR